jgi:hypothetical protein
MTRRWIGSADVEVNEAGALSVRIANAEALPVSIAEAGVLSVRVVPPSTLAGGTKTCANQAVAEKLVAASTPCRAVWVGPRVTSAGAAQNTKPVFIGDSAGQNIPVMPTSYEGLTLLVDDASKVYVKVGTNGEGVAYRVFA